MLLPFVISHELPLTDPVLKFLLLLNKLKIPHLLGLIIAGAIIGPNGLNLVLRDSSIILSGTAGLLYIMFLAGLEIDMGDFKKNSGRSFVFGMYTFLIPMALGIVAGLYVLHFSMETSILLASMFASHTLIAYPIISKLGITKDKSVTITVGGTMITDMLALLVLTVIVGMATGVIGEHFWTRLSISIVIFVLFVVIAFPIAGRWFFKHVQDSISQYIFDSCCPPSILFNQSLLLGTVSSKISAFIQKKHKTTARTPLLCAFNIYCFIKLIHNSSDFSRMTIISITNLNTITRVAGMNYHTAANIHRNVVNTASVAVEEQIARFW